MAYGRVPDFPVQSGGVLEARSLAVVLEALLPEFYVAHGALARPADAAATVAPQLVAKTRDVPKSSEASSITGSAEG